MSWIRECSSVDTRLALGGNRFHRHAIFMIPQWVPCVMANFACLERRYIHPFFSHEFRIRVFARQNTWHMELLTQCGSLYQNSQLVSIGCVDFLDRRAYVRTSVRFT